MSLVDAEVRINVWTYLPNSVKEDVIHCLRACCFTVGCFAHAVLFSEMFSTSAQNYVYAYTHSTLARRTYFSLLTFSSVSLPFWRLFWLSDQVFQSTYSILLQSVPTACPWPLTVSSRRTGASCYLPTLYLQHSLECLSYSKLTTTSWLKNYCIGKWVKKE